MKNYYIVMDTETCNTMRNEATGDLNVRGACVYDWGWAVIDKKGRVYRTRSFIINEVFNGMPDLMKSAYYAEKIPQYIDGITDGKYEVVSFFTALEMFIKDAEDFNVKAVIAHNARFDISALNSTIAILSNGNVWQCLPQFEIWDTLSMARSTVCKQKTYRKWCEKHEQLTKNNRVRATAEALYRYLSHEQDFDEAHTALADVLIEAQIFDLCIRQHKKMKKVLYTAVVA